MDLPSFMRVWTNPPCNSLANNLTTPGLRKEISYPCQAFGRSQCRSPFEIMETVLGPECFAVRGIFFNKTRSSNWKVVWHQDLTIAVRERTEISGFGPWTMKAGVLHVQPPPEIMNGILAIRLHLDESGVDNGPLRVIAGSHREGRLSKEQIGIVDKENAVTCTVRSGGALIRNQSRVATKLNGLKTNTSGNRMQR